MEWFENSAGVKVETGCVRILHLEYSADDACLIHRVIEQEGLSCAITLASSRSKFEAVLKERRFDLILCDHRIPGYGGFAALKFARQNQPHIPVIILSGMLSDAQAVEYLKSGATDYILKQRLARLVPAIRRALQEAEEQTKQRAAEERIRQQANLLNLTSDAIIVRTMGNRIVFWNQGAATLFGWSEQQALGQDFGALLHGDASLLAAAGKSLIESGNWIGEFQLRTRAGGEIIVFSRWNLVRDKAGQPRAVFSANTDITEKKKTEAVVLRAQRMDSIGALAEGIAHDLNNELVPVLMSATILKQSEGDPGRRRFLEIIYSSAQRATGMVGQILGFARGRGGGKQPVALSHLLREMAAVIGDTYPKTISIGLNFAETDLWKIQGDATTLHQVLLNLCVNARDAMPAGGQLTLCALNVRLDSEAAARLNGRPGPHVLISVADTGGGIPADVLPQIFEPFFTTKLPHEGTGLGLSIVANIVRHHGGCIDVKSELGQGTEFRIYLPATECVEEVETQPQRVVLPAGHGELILIIEDEEAMRELTKTTLENYGYRVVAAQNGVQGISRFEEHQNEVRALITDTDMPYMDGLAVVRAIRELKPNMPVIVASGSKGDTEDLRRLDAKHLTNLGKPFSLEQLLIALYKAVHH
jgi:two-component system cell cycle sensor histidine kinase/response regulator CckA